MFDLVPFHKNSIGRRGDDFFSNFMNNFFDESFMPHNLWNSSTFNLDLKEDENDYVVEADIPGVNKEAIDVEYSNNYLTISAKRDDSTEQDKDNYIRKERHYGVFKRTIYVDNVDPNNVSASFKDGVLTITLPKLEKTSVTKRKIDIN
ncbi:heat shock protein Hsp18 [Clostridium oryzae]|uniref:18 kDa heat shock protein n=1 Tax=Clostridium oryzae TaxID=1450648 RepID=A0A1V4IGN0_9CLOT|nr:heat shock protein Hsp18 [Clostridium oryzae]OPJ58697.1 18 kDa heat shock protein [Clostridium oryzae]